MEDTGVELRRANSQAEYVLFDGTEEECPDGVVLDMDEEASLRYRRRKKWILGGITLVGLGLFAGLIGFLLNQRDRGENVGVTPTMSPLATPGASPTFPPPREPPPEPTGFIPTPPPKPSQGGNTPVMGYKIISSVPHDIRAFTQGLLFYQDQFYESTGLLGQSSLRRVDPKNGTVLKKINIDSSLFGEGLARVGNTLYMLTWQSKRGLRFQLDNFTPRDGWNYSGEGWGLTTSSDERKLYMSDGSDEIRVLDPSTLEEVASRIKVRDQRGSSIRRINELEFVEGEIWANIWQTDNIARIDPTTGEVLAWIDFRGLLQPEDIPSGARIDVLNGIAYDSTTKRLWVTGKLWPKYYLVEIV